MYINKKPGKRVSVKTIVIYEKHTVVTQKFSKT